MAARARRWIGPVALACAALQLGGCVVVPRTEQVYDADCRAMRRQMVLDVQQIGTLGHCHNEGCAAALVAIGAVATVTAVVSGSVVLVGNVVYWIEARTQCRGAEPLPAAPVSGGSGGSGAPR